MLLLMAWPAVGLAALLMILGLAHERAVFVVAAGVLTLPLSLYLAATPRFPWAFLLPAATFAAALLLHRGARRWAGLVVAAVLGSFAYLVPSIYG